MDSQVSSNKTTLYFLQRLTILSISGTNPRTEVNIKVFGLFSIKIFSKYSKSTDRSSRLMSHKIGFKPSCITGDRSVDHAKAGTTTASSRFSLFNCISESNINRFAEEPELQKTEYFLPIQFDHFSSSCLVIGPFVSLG